MKKMLSRKLLVFILVLLVFAWFFNITKYESVQIIICILIATFGAIYIGGNVWKAWIKSKYFQPGLVEKFKPAGNGAVRISDEQGK